MMTTCSPQSDFSDAFACRWIESGAKGLAEAPAQEDHAESDPLSQFILQIGIERKQLLASFKSDCVPSDINTHAYHAAIKTWTQQEIWNPCWGVIPGMTWTDRNLAKSTTQVPTQRSSTKFSITSPSRGILAIIVSPGAVVRIGPDLQEGLFRIAADIHRVIKAQTWKLLAITYSLSALTIVFCAGHDISIVHLHRLRQSGGFLINSAFQDPALSRRIESQLGSIFKVHGAIKTPFICVEGWDGMGEQQHPIYEKMLRASTSPEAWAIFREAFNAKTANGKRTADVFKADDSQKIMKAARHD